MSNLSAHDFYSNLPDELIAEILQDIPLSAEILAQSIQLLRDSREELRYVLSQQDLIQIDSPRVVDSPPSVAAVDGTLAIEQTFGSDSVLVVAVGVPGLGSTNYPTWTDVQYRKWHQVLHRSAEEESRRFALGILACLKLEVGASAPHDVIYFDGSHITPIIGINSMLSANSLGFGAFATDLVVTRKAVRHLADFYRDERFVCVANRDVSKELAKFYLPGNDAVSDQMLMTIVLDEGEFTAPQPLALSEDRRHQMQELHIFARLPDLPDKESLEKSLMAAIRPAIDNQIYFTYYRPFEFSQAIRIEMKKSVVESPKQLARILASVRTQLTGPEITLPYPSFLAKSMTKSVGETLTAVMVAVQHLLTKNQSRPTTEILLT